MRRSLTSAPRGVTVACALAACGSAGAPARPAAQTCPTDRDVVLASQADVARLAGCATARGVTIRSGAALDLAGLRSLTAITGDLTIGPTVGMEDATLGELRSIAGALHVVGNGLMQGVFLRKLAAAGRIDIAGNAALTTIALPQLTTVHGALHVIDNASLELLDLSALTAIEQDLVVTGDPRLALLDAPALRAAGHVELDPGVLPSEVVAALRAAAPP